MARSVLKIGGADRISFLQGLITNDVTKASEGLVYAALLTPQGKYIADFFVSEMDDALIIDVEAELSAALSSRLNMYRLRADVTIEPSALVVSRTASALPGSFPDPRHPEMGFVSYGTVEHQDTTDWDAGRVAHVIPQSSIELTPDTYILEAGFERLNGIDFRKGCYVGQEIAARMKHKTELKKGLVQVEIDGAAPVGTPILSDGKVAGTLYTQSGDKALAHLRFDRATGPMTAESATVRYAPA